MTSSSNNYEPPAPMRRILDGTEDGLKSAAAQLFSTMCKPAYSARLQEIIGEKQATVFSTGYCPYCTKAKKLLDKNQVEYTEVMLDEISGVDQMEVANCIYGDDRRFVPFVYLNQQRLGSYGELHQMDQAGTLVPSAKPEQQL